MKIISASVILAVVLSFVLWRVTSKDAPAPQETVETRASREQVQAAQPSGTRASGSDAPMPADETALPPGEGETAGNEAMIEKIQDAATTYDAAYLRVIQPFLTNPDPEIRREAVDGMIILGDSAAAPMLREAATRMTTAEEVKSMLEAAEFLELPEADLTKYTRRKKEEGQKPDDRQRIPRSGRPQE